MAVLSVKSAKKKKRKLNSARGEEKPRKTPRIDPSEKGLKGVEEGGSSEPLEPNLKLEEERPWRNLQLMLSLQNKEIELLKKVELAFEYVGFRKQEGSGGVDEDYETVKTSRLVVFLNDWIQSLLIAPEKKVKVDGIVEACLDLRCWQIFKFCLEESSRLHVSLNFSRNLLRAISYIAGNVASLLSNTISSSKESMFGDEEFELYSVVLDCVSLLFSSQSGLSNENLDLWVSTTVAVIEMVHKVYIENLEGGKIGAFVLQFSCLVLEPFAKFLKVHPTRKNGFHDFVDKLLEPLLHLLSVLHGKIEENNPGWTRNLLKLVEEVLSHGLFHPAHIDGFLGLRSIEKYAGSEDGKVKNLKVVIKSYHRHLFDKLGSIVAEKRVVALDSTGELFSLFVDRVKTQKGTPVLFEGNKVKGKTGRSRHLEDDTSGHVAGSSNLNAETRKSLLDFFVQILEPLLLKIDEYLQSNLPARFSLLDFNCTLKPINNLLASFMRERVYIRTEDITEGACFNFLKKVYDTIVSFASKLLCLSKSQIDTGMQKMFPSLAKELFVSIGYFLDIEYEVAGNDLIGLWLIVLSYLSSGLSFMDPQDQCLLTSPILDLGCQLINLYSALRQVSNCIFSLCKAARLLSQLSDGEVSCAGSLSSVMTLSNHTCAKSVRILLCSQEFKLAIHQAFKSIPEGQASECIQQLTADVSESMEWTKNSCSETDGKEFGRLEIGNCEVHFFMQAEILGTLFSEIYILLLDSLIVTSGNSSMLGLYVKKMMTTIQPFISSLARLKPDGIYEFLSSLSGRALDNMIAENRNKKYLISFYWIFVFFSRLYMSCRSLYRQIIGLAPPNESRKMATEIGDAFTVYTGRDWMEKDLTDKGYFSWILNPSPSVLELLHCISNIYFKDNIGDCCPLIYVLNAIALQRLVDLNRHIMSLQYLLQHNDNFIQAKMNDDADLSLASKKSRKLKRHISILKKEAVGLTDFMLGFLSLVANNQPLTSASNDASCENKCFKVHGNNGWDLGVCTLDEKSLPSAIWWVICQNVDIWCAHAATKKMKKFLTLLLQTSLPCLSRSYMQGQEDIDKAGWLKKVSVPQISMELLKDSSLYDHKFVRRTFASRYCGILSQYALRLFRHSSIEDFCFNATPNWPEVLSTLNTLSAAVSSKRDVKYGSAVESISNSSDSDISKPQKSFLVTECTVKDCHSLLNFLCWMPKEYLSSTSFSLLATHILNLEWLVVASLLQCQGALLNYHKLLQLFVACRRTLKNIIMASCKKTENSQSSLLPVIAESSLFFSWLFKSVCVVGELPESWTEDCASESKRMLFSLMDHTSYVFLTISKYQLGHAALYFTNAEWPSRQSSSGIVEKHGIDEMDSCLDYSGESEALRSLLVVAESLKEHAESLLISLKDALPNEKVLVEDNVVNINKSSVVVSCISGFLWGLASAIELIGEKSSEHKAKFLSRKCKPFLKLNLCVNIFADTICDFLQLMFVNNNQQPFSYCNAKSFEELDGNKLLGSGEFSPCNMSSGKQHLELESIRIDPASSDIGDNSATAPVHKSTSPMENAYCSGTEVNLIELHGLRKHILQDLFKGKHPEMAILLRHLLIASSAILSLNLYMNNTILLSSLVPISTGISQLLLLELANSFEIPQPFTFVWLDGVLKYLEELGNNFTSTNPTLNGDEYTKLIGLHLRAIGKCISLQGKRATLESRERESNTRILHGGMGFSESFLSHEQHCLNDFKARLRMSFKVFIKKPPELLLSSAVEAIERALVGVQGGWTTIYEINNGNPNGGRVSSVLVAGIDCLDLVLEYVSGRNRLSVVKRHIPSLIAALFNIILHLQGPLIFFENLVGNNGDNNPDPGSIILMCVQVLTRVSGKHALFQMDSWHIGQCLHIPGALFQAFCQLRHSEAPESYNSLLLLDKQNDAPSTSMEFCVLDQQFSVNLFVACCRLLYTIVKHHKSECERCIAVLEESVSVLLHCLETVNAHLAVRRGCFSWEVEEGVKCAGFLRRIYEEIRQQKDAFAQHSFKFLSTYIWVYSGCGPLKAGIQREIDEALRPGVYALIDACSTNDLQYLHTVFGEGPCRNTLAGLQHDYKRNFQYEGKV
ncbi:hypothetical protein SLE2022_200200 [Rubroshorea leprosula]